MYSAKETAKMTGLSTATLRYYEKEKLLPQIARNSKITGNIQTRTLNGLK